MKQLLVLLLIATIAIGGYLYYNFYKKNIYFGSDEYYLHIPRGATLNDVANILTKDGVLLSQKSFLDQAKKKKYSPRNGRFELENGMSNPALVKHLMTGEQAPLRVIIHNKRLIEEVAGHMAKFIEPDSANLMATFQDEEFLAALGYTPDNIMAAFIPNTYELFWNTTPKALCKRMVSESKRFWTEERLAKARKMDLTPIEVIILASIVQMETNQDDEKDRIAGVYYNRLKTPGWKLQADPTVVYAMRAWGIPRLLRKHTKIDSPYNTYKVKGLPPGPIAMPSIITIDKTLDAEEHDYMYFCAKPDRSGYHAFAKTYEAHLVNARRYHKARRLENR